MEGQQEVWWGVVYSGDVSKMKLEEDLASHKRSFISGAGEIHGEVLRRGLTYTGISERFLGLHSRGWWRDGGGVGGGWGYR